MKYLDLVGKRFGKLTVLKLNKIGYLTDGRNHYYEYLCKCDCGNTKLVRYRSLVNGQTKSCGCYRHEFRLAKYDGLRFGSLTVIKRVTVNGKNRWECVCDCGNIVYAKSANLKNGKTNRCVSCGRKITHEKVTKHGMAGTRIYHIYLGMKDRCYDKSTFSYKYYGALGVKICDEWLNDPKAFYEWAVNNGYKNDLTLDRIDPTGNYTPDNCRWADYITQANNKRNSKHYLYNGESLSVKQLSRKYCVSEERIRGRIKKGMDINEIMDFLISEQNDKVG